METLKKNIFVAALVFSCLVSCAQSETSLQKAFKDSYAQEAKKSYADAIGTLNKVYDDKSYELNLRLGWLNYLNKNYTQSAGYYQKAIALKPYAIEAKLGALKPLGALESWDKVLQTYEDILKIDPLNTTANYWSGVILYNRKKYEQAAKLFEKIVNLYPFDYESNHMLAWTYLNLGRNNDAKVLFNKALLISPGDASSLDGLSKVK